MSLILGHQPRAKPSKLSISCNECGRNIPFDPSFSSRLCNICTEMAIKRENGLSPLMKSDGIQDRHPFSSPLAASPTTAVKREADQPSNSEPARKRALTSAYADPRKSMFYRPPIGAAQPEPEEGETIVNESEDEEFVDAQEEIGSDNEEGGASDGGNEDERSESYTDGLGPQFPKDRGEDMDDVEGAGQADLTVVGEEDDDLFANAFGKNATKESNDEEEEDSDDELQIFGETNVSKEITQPKDNFHQDEHAKGCDPSHRPQTPTDTDAPVQPTGPKPIKANNGPNDDRSYNLKRLTMFHNRVFGLIPRLSIPHHRYWIGVLSADRSWESKNIASEKDFLWMKGNRMTTVETVWNMFQQSTATEDFVLLLGYEKPKPTDRMEELDYFGDKKLFFRAVLKDKEGAKGIELSAGAVPKDKVQKKVVSEVVVIDDDDDDK